MMFVILNEMKILFCGCSPIFSLLRFFTAFRMTILLSVELSLAFLRMGNGFEFSNSVNGTSQRLFSTLKSVEPFGTLWID